MDYKNINKKHQTIDANKLFKVSNIDFLLLGYYLGQLDNMKLSNTLKFYEDKEFKDREVSTSSIIDGFANKFNIDYGTISKRQLINKLNTMLISIDKGFFTC